MKTVDLYGSLFECSFPEIKKKFVVSKNTPHVIVGDTIAGFQAT